jgi:hypothetical protein
LALLMGFGLGLSLTVGAVSAQTESATAEDGTSAAEAEETTETTPAPTVPVGANLAPPVGIVPPGPALVSGPGQGLPGSSSVSMAPGTQTTGVAREGRNAERAPEAAPDPAATACGEYPTWYDAQLALESTLDEGLMAALDPDGDAIACEELMY